MIDDTQENVIKEFRFLSELVSLKNRVKELEDLNSDLSEDMTRLQNCINCKHKKWCKEIPDDFSGCHDWDWED